MGKPILGYWNFRGQAEPVRFLLHYKKVDFEDRQYLFRSEGWQKDMLSLGLDFPDVPYYIDGDIKLTQIATILRYLAQKHGLDGKNDEKKLRVSLAEQQIYDLFWRWVTLNFFTNEYETAKEEFIKNIPSQIELWEKFIGDHKFLTGDDITYVDFVAYETFDFCRLLHAETLDGFPALQAFQKRIRTLPELQEYLNSSTYKRWPICAHISKFGGGGDEPKHA